MSQASAGYAELNIDRLTLLLPRREVVRVLPAAGIGGEPVKGGWCGRVSAGGVKWPVLSLNEFLEPAPDKARKRTVCVLLRTGNHGFGLLADAVMSRAEADARPLELPAVMATPEVTVGALALIDDYVAGLAEARQILHRHARLRDTESGQVLELLG